MIKRFRKSLIVAGVAVLGMTSITPASAQSVDPAQALFAIPQAALLVVGGVTAAVGGILEIGANQVGNGGSYAREPMKMPTWASYYSRPAATPVVAPAPAPAKVYPPCSRTLRDNCTQRR